MQVRCPCILALRAFWGLLSPACSRRAACSRISAVSRSAGLHLCIGRCSCSLRVCVLSVSACPRSVSHLPKRANASLVARAPRPLALRLLSSRFAADSEMCVQLFALTPRFASTSLLGSRPAQPPPECTDFLYFGTSDLHFCGSSELLRAF